MSKKLTLLGGHLNSVFLEEDEAKSIVNPIDSSSVFLGPKQVRARATLDISPDLADDDAVDVEVDDDYVANISDAHRT